MKINQQLIPTNAIKTCQMLQNNGFEAYLVGGCVRDLLLGDKPKDFDITTNAKPNEVMQIFSPKGEGKYPKYYPTGIEHGTITVALGENPETDHFEVTTYRSEGKYTDGRRPEEVYFEQDINKDLERRDLTINAIAYDPINDKIVDPFNGQGDLDKKIVKAVGSADDRFQEDGLRSMRAARFAARFGFDLDPETKEAISNNLETLSKVSKERIRDELTKTLKTNDPKKGMEILLETGIFGLLGKLGSNPRLRSNIEKLNQSSKSMDIRLAILFYGLPVVDVNQEMRDLRFSNDEIERIVLLLNKLYAFEKLDVNNQKEVSKYLASIKNESKGKYVEVLQSLVQLGSILKDSKINILKDKKETIGEKELLIKGNDLISLGLKPGPLMKEILKELYESVVIGEVENNIEKLKEKAKVLIELKQKKAKIQHRMNLMKLAAREGFWTLPEDERKRLLRQVYDFGPYGKHEAGEIPHIREMIDVPAGPEEHHPEKNQAIHNYMVYEQARRLSDDPRDWYAAALHDLGKVHTDKEIWPKQHGHESGGVPHVESLSRMLGVPQEWEDIAKLVAEHHLKGHTAKELNPKTLKRFFELFKNEKDFRTFLTAIEADQRGRLGKEEESHPNISYLTEKRTQHLEDLNKPAPIKVELAISAQDLQRELGISPGKQLGDIIKTLKKEITDKPDLNEYNILLEMAKRM